MESAEGSQHESSHDPDGDHIKVTSSQLLEVKDTHEKQSRDNGAKVMAETGSAQDDVMNDHRQDQHAEKTQLDHEADKSQALFGDQRQRHEYGIDRHAVAQGKHHIVPTSQGQDVLHMNCGLTEDNLTVTQGRQSLEALMTLNQSLNQTEEGKQPAFDTRVVVSQFPITTRVSHKHRKLIVKDYEYQVELHAKNLRLAMQAHSNLVQQCRDLLSHTEINLPDLYQYRIRLEDAMLTITDHFNALGKLSLEESKIFESNVDACKIDNRLMLHNVTESIRHIENTKHVHDRPSCQSRHSSNSSRSNPGSVHSSCSSQQHSCASNASSQKSSRDIILEAATKAAEIQAKLQYIEATEMHRVALEKLSLMKDFAVEKAKIDTIQALDRESFVNLSNVECINTVSTPKVDHISLQRLTSDQSRLVNKETIKHGVSYKTTALDGKVSSVDRMWLTGNPTLNHSLDPTAVEFVPQSGKAISQRGNVSCQSQSNHVSTEQSICEAVKTLSDIATVSRLPIPEPGVFCGDALEYPSWRTAFQTLIENKRIDPAEKVYYLKRYLGGKARESVEGYLLIPTCDSYNAAMSLIDKRYGGSFVVAQAFKSKIEQWPKIGPKDASALQRFSDFLSQCEVAARTNSSLRVLNDDIQNRAMLTKLPDWLVNRWARVVHASLEEHNVYPSFPEFVCFLRREAEIACNPITMLQGSNLTGNVGNVTSSHIGHRHANGKTFNTVLHDKSCMLCGNNDHSLNVCEEFKSRSLEDRKAFVKENKLCFACLRSGHMSSSCISKLTCTICSKTHPTSLHGFIRMKPADKTHHPTDEVDISAKGDDDSIEVSKNEIATGNSFLATNQSSNKSTMVVPVYVSSSQNSQTEILTYALLDMQSDVSFIDTGLMHKLNVGSVDTKLLLSTMTADKMMMCCKVVSGLVVRAYNDNQCIDLPPMYTHDNIPADENCIPTPSLADAWPYLKPMAGELMPKGKFGIGLLIGYNCPRALVPREVIASQGNGPFALRTDLGWGVIGMVNSRNNDGCTLMLKSHISLKTSGEEIICCCDICKCFSKKEGYTGSSPKSSMDDKRYMQTMQGESTKTDDNHFHMPLCFRDKHVVLPDKVSEVDRLQGIVKCFIHDSKYCCDHKVIQDLELMRTAESVSESEVDDRAIDIHPHRGIYSPYMSDNLELLRNGNRKFQGTLFNDILLSYLYWISMLIVVICRFQQEKVTGRVHRISNICCIHHGHYALTQQYVVNVACYEYTADQLGLTDWFTGSLFSWLVKIKHKHGISFVVDVVNDEIKQLHSELKQPGRRMTINLVIGIISVMPKVGHTVLFAGRIGGQNDKMIEINAENDCLNRTVSVLSVVIFMCFPICSHCNSSITS